MVFSSLAFLFMFLPLLLAAYFFAPERWRNWVLLIGSLVFYAWGGPRYLLLLMFETLTCWICALMADAAEDKREKKVYLIIACAILLGLLCYFKYTGLFLGTTHALFGVPAEVVAPILPIGISFYTFQLISYVADVTKGEVEAQSSYWKLLLYSSLFHQCIAGPIVRYKTVAGEIEHREVHRNDVYYGVRRFCCGLAKKAILANACASVADTLVPIGGAALANQTVCGYWIGMIFYTLQIYLDFSAYSDMAIGLGRMVGFHYLENFDHPYESSSVQEFWRRWHISLGSFFRDYVYIPLGGSRCDTLTYVRNMTVVWLLTGFWHGASWNYVLWGAFYLGLLLLERFVIRGRLPKVAGHLLTLLAVFIGWVLFRFENFGEMARVLGGLIGIGASGFSNLATQTVLLQNIFLLVFACVACTSLGMRLRHQLALRARGSEMAFRVYSVLELVTPPLLLLISIVALAGANYNPFIYFQF